MRRASSPPSPSRPLYAALRSATSAPAESARREPRCARQAAGRASTAARLRGSVRQVSHILRSGGRRKVIFRLSYRWV